SAIVQTVTPDRFRGRVLAADYVVGAGGGELGNIEAGTVGSLASPTIAVLSGGLATIASAALISLPPPPPPPDPPPPDAPPLAAGRRRAAGRRSAAARAGYRPRRNPVASGDRPTP